MSKVSIIIPFYNNPKQLSKAIHSVLSQTYTNLELIVVDDGSEKDYRDYVKSIDSRIEYIRQDNTGPGLARQSGLKFSSGKYIQYLDSDDELLPDKLSKQVKILQQNPSAIMVYGLSMINSNKNNIHRKSNFKGNEDHVSVSALQKRKWHTSSCLWNYDSNKNYWEDLKNGEDVLHDVNAGLYNENKHVIFHNDFVSNITMSNDPRHLSNAAKDVKNHKQIVRDASELNNRIYRKLEKLKHNQNIFFLKPLCERYFFEGLKFIKINHLDQGLEMLKRGFDISKTYTQKIEFILVYSLFRYKILNKQNVKVVFKLHKLFCGKIQHQYRNL